MKRLFLLTTTIFAGMMICAISDVYAQAKSDKLKTIDIKTDNIEILNIDNLPKVKFNPGEDMKNLVGYMPTPPYPFGDKFLIGSSLAQAGLNKIMVYNRKGEYVNTITQTGNAQYELSGGTHRNVWVKDGYIYVLDSRLRILKFTPEGKFVAEYEIKKPSEKSSLLNIAPLGDGYLAQLATITDNEDEFLPILARYDKNFKFVEYVGEDVIKTSLWGTHFYFTFGNSANLEQFGYIYNIDSKFKVTNALKIGFDGMFYDEFSTVAEEKALINRAKSVGRYIRNINLTKNYLTFTYRHKRKDYLAVCNLKSGKSKVYNTQSSSVVLGILYEGDKMYFFNEGDDWTNMCIIENVGDLLK